MQLPGSARSYAPRGKDVDQQSPVKTVLTTRDAAQISGLSRTQVIRCFDEGILPGWRIPGSKHRRIPRDRLLDFMRQHNIPQGVTHGQG